VTQKLDQIQQELMRAQADRVAKQSKYELVATSPPDSLPDIIDDVILRDYQNRFVELRRQYAELTSALTPAHPQVKRLEAQIAEIRANAAERRTNVINRIRNDYQQARRRESLLETAYAGQLKMVEQQGTKSIEYNALKRDVDSARDLYESMLRKFKEAGVAAAMRVSNIRVVDRAKTPKFPVKPDQKLNLVLGSVAGLFLGIGFVFMREKAQRNLKNPGEAKLYLNVPELGLIPAAHSDPVDTVRKWRPGLLSVTGSQANEYKGTHDGLELVTWHNRFSLTAESYRSALTSILLSGERESGRRPEIILLTSPGPREGKTTTVCNLGIAIAEMTAQTNQSRVLLIDGDLRKARLHKIFGISENTGLCDLLLDTRPAETCPLDGLVRATEIPGLFVLPSGTFQGPIAKLLYSERLGQFLNRFRREFDTVLIDTPPMISISDARVLARWADAVILVLRSDHTDKDVALIAREQLRDDGTPLLGTILTDWDPKKAGPTSGFNKRYMGYMHYYEGAQDA
jgi:capsular exopolysaccharide synthesis family protein